MFVRSSFYISIQISYWLVDLALSIIGNGVLKSPTDCCWIDFFCSFSFYFIYLGFLLESNVYNYIFLMIDPFMIGKYFSLSPKIFLSLFYILVELLQNSCDCCFIIDFFKKKSIEWPNIKSWYLLSTFYCGDHIMLSFIRVFYSPLLQI